MTLNEFIDKYLGKKIDWDSAYGGQCVDLFRQYVNDCLTGKQPKGVSGAADFWINYDTDPYLNQYFDKIPNTPTGIPLNGDVVIWNKKSGGGFGHIAVFIEGNASSFTSFDQNWPTLSVCTKTIHNYTNVYGWLHPKESMLADEIAVKKTDFENLVKKSTALDEILSKYGVADAQGIYSMVQGKDSRITDLTNQLGVCQANDKNKDEIISRLNTQLLTAQDDVETLTGRIDQCANTVAQLGKDKGTLAIQVEQLKIQVDTLKQQAVQGGVTLSVKDFFTMLWNGKITLGGK